MARKYLASRLIPKVTHYALDAEELQTENGLQGDLTWRWFDQSDGVVEWIFLNRTAIPREYALWRGTAAVSPYWFGNAFYPVYLGEVDGQRLAYPLTKLVPNAENPYSLAMLNNQAVAFVFVVPPQASLGILEGGFVDDPPTVYQGYPATTKGIHTFCVYWNQAQYLLYFLEVNAASPQPVTVVPVTDPLTLTAHSFSVSAGVSNLFPTITLKGACFPSSL